MNRVFGRSDLWTATGGSPKHLFPLLNLPVFNRPKRYALLRRRLLQ
jgi:hypothetical protein